MTMPPRELKVLVVEDNAGDAGLLRRALEQSKKVSCKVRAVDRLSAALEHLASGEFDVALLDLNLPDSSGLATYTQAHAHSKTPIIVLTGLDDDELAVRAVNAGAQDYLHKGSVDTKEVLRSILYAIERHRRSSQVGRGVGKVFAVSGTKGGVGRTLVALNLACALAEFSHPERVTLVDLDLQFGDLGMLLNVAGKGDLGDLASDLGPDPDAAGATFDDAFWSRYVFSVGDRLQVLASPVKPELADIVRAPHVRTLLRELPKRTSYVVIDTAAHVDDVALEAFERSDRIVLLTEPFLPAIKDAKVVLALFEMLRVPLEKVVLVLNKSGAEGGLTSEQVRSNLTLPVALEIPNHPMATNRTMQTGDALVVTAPDSASPIGSALWPRS